MGEKRETMFIKGEKRGEERNNVNKNGREERNNVYKRREKRRREKQCS